MSNIVCPECGASAIVNHEANCSHPAYVDLRPKTLREDWRCVCAGQGGSVYSAECPIHDPRVDTSDPRWRKWYDDHLEARRRIKERLGW